MKSFENTKILGICDNHDSGACLFVNGKLVDAISEERLNRNKLTRKFPYKSIKKILAKHNLSIGELDKIIISSTMTPSFIIRLFNKFYSNIKKHSQFSYFLNLYIIYQSLARKSLFIEKIDNFFSRTIIRKRLKIKSSKLHFIDHHESHAASAYYTSGLNKALIITVDGMGDGVSLTVGIGKGRIIKKLFSQSGFSSIGLYYSKFTECLGFKPVRHEGKITGLAAYGNHGETFRLMKNLLSFKKTGFNTINYFVPDSKKRGIFKKIERYSREDVAAGVQKNLEEQICKFVSYWVKKTGIRDIVFAGGLFANVKLNQRIHNLENVNSVYIFPHMGDGGLCLGAVLAYLKPESKALDNIFLGPEYSEEEIHNELNKSGLKFEYYKNIEKEIAKLLAKNKVIARFNGRMEYGPRALGNRSILYPATDPKVNDWLNKRLNRTEFMPFAPVTLEEYTKKCYKNTEGAMHAAKFMTICFDCTDFMKKKSPAVVHVDGTARPQIINKKDNLSYYKILDDYRKITNIPTIVNTSFNMHEEPIVCTPKDAIRAFLLGNLDYLAMGNFLANNKN